MNVEFSKSFMTSYLLSLGERSRLEKGTQKWGLDWVIYNMGQALYGKPIRLPFAREPESKLPKSKPECEFGIDLSFLSEDETEFHIFVLKAKRLNNGNWTSCNFDEDLRKAICPDLEAKDLQHVKSINVILAYNRDDDNNGIELFDRFVKCAPKEIAEGVSLTINRLNLSDLVDLTLKHLLSPSLLPQDFFVQLAFISAQVAEFKHGSDQWNQQLIPAWRRFVDDLLIGSSGIRGANVIPVVLLILFEHGKNNDSFETGWIDLIEWASIAMWNQYLKSNDENFKLSAHRFWKEFYIAELTRFYTAHIEALSTKYAIDNLAHRGANFLGAISAANIAYWHITRLGILSLFFAYTPKSESEEAEKVVNDALATVANWIMAIMRANQAVYRPLLDIHHIQIFLIIRAFVSAKRNREVVNFFPKLILNLFFRRVGKSEIPFLDGNNSLENVLEQVANSNKQNLLLKDSSFFIMMLMEIACAFPKEDRDIILPDIYKKLVLGLFDSGEQDLTKALELFSWIPPKDWEKKVFEGTFMDGEAISLGSLMKTKNPSADEIVDKIVDLVSQTRDIGKFPDSLGAPVEATILASVKFDSPIPPEMWRWFVFPKEGNEKAE